jgi:1-deoxy-D-xylulose-5-phosphate synthase
LADAGLTAQAITRDVVAQVVGSKIPVARPLPDDVASPPLAAENAKRKK